jgi:hypothetical protein
LIAGTSRHTIAVLEHLGILIVDERSEITSIVENQVQVLAILEGSELLLQAPVVLLLGLALPGKDRYARGSNGGSSVILGREDVAAGPGKLGAEGLERLDKDGGLDG